MKLRKPTKRDIKIGGILLLAVFILGISILEVAKIAVPPVYSEKNRGIFWDGWHPYTHEKFSSADDEVECYNQKLKEEYGITLTKKNMPIYGHNEILGFFFKEEYKIYEEYISNAEKTIYLDPNERYLWYQRGIRVYVYSVRPEIQTISITIGSFDINNTNSTDWEKGEIDE